MGKYNIPKGYSLDLTTGLYVEEILAENEKGERVKVITYFNDETGEYTREIESVGDNLVPPPPPVPEDVMRTVVVEGKKEDTNDEPIEDAIDEPIENSVDVTIEEPVKNGGEQRKSKTDIIIAILMLIVIIVAILCVIFLKPFNNNLADKKDFGAFEKEKSKMRTEMYSKPAEIVETESAMPKTETETMSDEVSEETVDELVETSESKEEDTISEEIQEEASKEDIPKEEKEPAKNRVFGVDYIEGRFIASDLDIPRAYAPTIEFRKDNTCLIVLNFTEYTEEFSAKYTLSKKKNEMDDLYVYITFDKTNGTFDKKCTVMFSDSYDFCYFMDEGYGLMGYSGAPYGFGGMD